MAYGRLKNNGNLFDVWHNSQETYHLQVWQEDRLIMANPILKQTDDGDTYVTFSIADLQELGKEENPNMWMGSGIFYCLNCDDYKRHTAMSTKGMSDCFEICSACKHYSTSLNRAIMRGLVNKNQFKTGDYK